MVSKCIGVVLLVALAVPSAHARDPRLERLSQVWKTPLEDACQRLKSVPETLGEAPTQAEVALWSFANSGGRATCASNVVVSTGDARTLESSGFPVDVSAPVSSRAYLARPGVNASVMSSADMKMVTGYNGVSTWTFTDKAKRTTMDDAIWANVERNMLGATMVAPPSEDVDSMWRDSNGRSGTLGIDLAWIELDSPAVSEERDGRAAWRLSRESEDRPDYDGDGKPDSVQKERWVIWIDRTSGHPIRMETVLEIELPGIHVSTTEMAWDFLSLDIGPKEMRSLTRVTNETRIERTTDVSKLGVEYKTKREQKRAQKAMERLDKAVEQNMAEVQRQVRETTTVVQFDPPQPPPLFFSDYLALRCNMSDPAEAKLVSLVRESEDLGVDKGYEQRRALAQSVSDYLTEMRAAGGPPCKDMGR